MLWLGVVLWVLVVALAICLLRLFGGGEVVSLFILGTLAVLTAGIFLALTLRLLQVLAPGSPHRPARAVREDRVVWRGFRLAPSARDASSPLDLWDIPGYEVFEKVGSGGMAAVFRARRKRGGEIVALKIPAESFTTDERFIRRFHREAEVAQRLQHPNIVRTFEHGSVGAKHFMAMEFVDGYSLESYLDTPEHRSNYAVSRELMRQAVAALGYVHEAGIVHRDIKPANLMLRRGGLSAAGVAPDALKLADFGVAGGQMLAKTGVGARIGTPTYMSPEQARGLRTDERSDIYSLGLVFYELLTGQPAFRGSYEVTLHQQIFGLPPPPRQHDPRVPVQLERLVMQMIAKEPGARPSLAEVAYRLCETFLPELEPKSRLLCAVSAPQGALRILDTGGTLHRALGDVGAALPSPPQACVEDSLGNLYVAVTEGGLGADCPMIYKLGPGGEVLLSFGPYGTQPGEFLRPVALALAPDESLWVLDAETHRVEHFCKDSRFLGGFGGTGGGEGRFNDPRDLLTDAHGELFVLDYGNRQVQHFGADGLYQNRWAFRAEGGTAGLRQLSGFTLSRTGDLYLHEALSGKVYRIAPSGDALGSLVLRQTDDAGPDTLVDLGVDEAGNLFVARRGGSAICKYAPSGELLATLETYAPILQLRVDVRA